jgi:glycerophosphoryl diester phosphodiesterase
LDVHKTKDDSLVVIHDYDILRTSTKGIKGVIAEMNYVDVAQVGVGAPAAFGDTFEDVKIPTLREALSLAKGKIKVCIEVKILDIEENVMNTVNELQVNDEVIIFSFYYPVLEKFRALDSEIPILYLKGAANNETLDEAKAINAAAIGVGSGTLVDIEFLSIAHKKGLEVWQWTVNDEAKMKELVGFGIDGIITNYPDIALKIR